MGRFVIAGTPPPAASRRPEYRFAVGTLLLAANLHDCGIMELERILDRCHALEQRAAAAYRSFAAAARGTPEVCALWTRLAREEEEHARSIATIRTASGVRVAETRSSP